MKSVRTRFAPSPTGFVHVGSIYAALFSYAFARKNGGQFVVRVEDTDQERLVAGAEDALFEGLAWVGLTPDESPRHGGAYGPYRQSERLDIYRRYAQELIDKGLAYYAFETAEELEKVRQEQMALKLPPKYDRKALQLSAEDVQKRLTAGEPHVIRLKVPAGQSLSFTDVVRGEITFQTDDIDDQVLLKSDGFPTYHLAVVVDDHLMEISHVIRAEEWISSTPKHILLYQSFGWEIPVYAHLPIIRNPDKSKMSKRHGHADLRWYKEQGILPEALINYLSLLGWSHPEEKEKFDLEEFVSEFSLERIKPSSPIFDLEKMTWLNGVYIRDLKLEELEARLVEFQPNLSRQDSDYLRSVISLEQERTHTLAEFVEKTGFFFKDKLDYTSEVLVQKGKTVEETLKVLEKSKDIVESTQTWTVEELEKNFEILLTSFPDWNKRDLFMTVRGALSAQTSTPPLFEMLFVLGKDRCLSRLQHAGTFLRSL